MEIEVGISPFQLLISNLKISNMVEAAGIEPRVREDDSRSVSECSPPFEIRRDRLRQAGSRLSYLDKIRSAPPRIGASLARYMTPNPRSRTQPRLDGRLS